MFVPRLQACDCRADGVARGEHLLWTLVSLPGPEEAFQSVFLATRDDVNVEVGNALADAVVDRHERPFGLHGPFHGLRQKPSVRKERRDQLRRQVTQGCIVSLWDQQAMAGKERAAVEEGERNLILENDAARSRSPASSTTSA